MATVKVKLRSPSVNGNVGTIYYQVTHRRKIKRITTDIHLSPEYWDARAEQVSLTVENGWLIQGRIDRGAAVLRRIIRKQELSGCEYDADQLVALFLLQEKQQTFNTFIRKEIEQLSRCGRLGTARNYRRAMNSFASFLNGNDIAFSSLTEQLVDAYNAYLIQRGIVRNSTSFYMRILRAVYNKAVRQHFAEQTFPFQQVYTGIDHTRKRAVDEKVITRLFHLNLSFSKTLALARDLFIFSYCTRGMAFVDMAYLKKSNLRGQELVYIRHKTGQQLHVRIESCTREILARYSSQITAPYLLPILTTEEPNKAFSDYQIALNSYNRQLKRLSELLNLEYNLSSYTARHSWATAARNHKVPISVISAGMGHASERTTQIYLTMMEDSVIDAANHRIIAGLR